jgi:hypothetical protein
MEIWFEANEAAVRGLKIVDANNKMVTEQRYLPDIMLFDKDAIPRFSF